MLFHSALLIFIHYHNCLIGVLVRASGSKLLLVSNIYRAVPRTLETVFTASVFGAQHGKNTVEERQLVLMLRL